MIHSEAIYLHCQVFSPAQASLYSSYSCGTRRLRKKCGSIAASCQDTENWVCQISRRTGSSLMPTATAIMLSSDRSSQTSCRKHKHTEKSTFPCMDGPVEKPSLQISWLGEGMRSDWWRVVWRLALHTGRREVMTLRLPEEPCECVKEPKGARERMCERETEKGWESVERRGRETTMAVIAKYVSRLLWLFHPAISANFLS